MTHAAAPRTPSHHPHPDAAQLSEKWFRRRHETLNATERAILDAFHTRTHIARAPGTATVPKTFGERMADKVAEFGLGIHYKGRDELVLGLDLGWQRVDQKDSDNSISAATALRGSGDRNGKCPRDSNPQRSVHDSLVWNLMEAPRQ